MQAHVVDDSHLSQLRYRATWPFDSYHIRALSHVQLKHPSKSGKVTVKHPAKDFPIGTLKSIERQSGVRLR